jgi:hypothetical protein
MNEIVMQSEIKSRIYTVRGKEVMLDEDLAELYQVETRVFNQAVKRNKERFPDDFLKESVSTRCFSCLKKSMKT